MLDANNYLGKMLAERYRLIRVIGHGASSLVFYAEDMMVRREDGSALPVAVKVLDRDSGEYKMNSKSFRTEIHAVAGIPTSPHVVAIKDVSFHEDEHFIVMEYVSGKTLGEYLAEKGGKLSAKEIVSISLQLLQALRLAHEVGVVHRDIKPENIMVERADVVGKQVDIPGGSDMPFVKLADFGIALLPDEDLFAMKDKGVGTVHYISPEQASGGRVDARSDLYSLGVVMHVMATGSVPFDAGSPTGIISKHQTEAPHHVRNRNADIPLALDEIIFNAMQKNPAARYKDAAAMERRLKEVLRSLEGERARTDADDVFRGAALNVTGGDEPRKPVKVKKERAPKVKKAHPKAKKIAVLSSISVFVLALLIVGAVFLLPLISGPKTYDITIPKLTGSIYSETSTYPDGVVVPKANVKYVYTDDDAFPAGMIMSQEPAQGKVYYDVEKVEIALTVSLGPEMTDFFIPEAYRTNFETATEYLRDTYNYLGIMSDPEVLPLSEAIPGVEPGTVVGAYRVATGASISIDGDRIYKTKAEKIVLRVQPAEVVTVRIVGLDVLANASAVKSYLESNYRYVTVTGTANALGSDPNSWMPQGTVIGIEADNDAAEAVFKTSYENGESQKVLEITLLKDKKVNITLLVAWENPLAGQ